MSRVNWDLPGERLYEAGVDRGVLYIAGEDGIPWNGLVSVAQEPTGGEASPFYIDGVKYLNRSNPEEFEATIEAYTYPEKFGECDGSRSIADGLFATQQNRKHFGFAYRTMIGSDSQGLDHGYKIHIVYDALAAPSTRANATITDSPEPFNFSWKLTTKPISLSGYRPTGHFVIDSRQTRETTLAMLENVLYGTDDSASRLPDIGELLYIYTSTATSDIDGGAAGELAYATMDAGYPTTVNATTIDGGTP